MPHLTREGETSMEVAFLASAAKVEEALYAQRGWDYEKLWDTLDRIRDESEDAAHASWSHYVSTFDLWGSHIPGTNLTVFWRFDKGPILAVAIIASEDWMG